MEVNDDGEDKYFTFETVVDTILIIFRYFRFRS